MLATKNFIGNSRYSEYNPYIREAVTFTFRIGTVNEARFAVKTSIYPPPDFTAKFVTVT